MSLTRRDIREAAFTDQLGEVQELSLSNKGLADFGCIAELSNLTVLSVPFNTLTSLTALSTLIKLQSLNVSHNRLVNLKGLPTSITCLKASNNSISSLASLSACTQLQELWLQHNKLATLADLLPLGQLPALQRLCIASNPCGKQLQQDTLRTALVQLCVQLQVLDGQLVNATERQTASLQPSGFWPAPSAAATTITDLDSHAYSTPGSPAIVSGTALCVASPQSEMLPVVGRPTAGRRAASTGSAEQAGGRVMPRVPPRRRSHGTVLTGGGVNAGLTTDPPSDWPIQSGPTTPRDDCLGYPGLGLPGRLQDSDAMSVASSLLSSATRDTAASVQRRFGQGVPRIKQLPATSKFQAVLAALPQVDKARLPPTYKPAQGRARKLQPTPPPADATALVYQARYQSGSRGQAVRCCRDGSLSVSWPSGDLAITVDADHSSTPPTYRMLAMYRNTSNVAASWDASGGFIQYPNGTLCVVYNAADGTGTKFSQSGDILYKWTDKMLNHTHAPLLAARSNQTGSQGNGSVLEEFGCQGQGTPIGTQGGSIVPLKADTDSSDAARLQRVQHHLPVDVLLDSNFGARLCRHTKQLCLYWACDGSEFVAVCGFNGPGNASLQRVGHDPAPDFLTQLASGVSPGHRRPAPLKVTQTQPCTDQDDVPSVAGLLAKLNAFNARMQEQ